MKVEEVIPIVVGVLGAVQMALLRDLEILEIGRRIKTIQTTAGFETCHIYLMQRCNNKRNNLDHNGV